MRKQYNTSYKSVEIKCTCGAIYKTKSTKKYSIDLCSKCHPFFTGKEKILDVSKRIEKFRNKYAKKNI
jgi:large subunit ribosomal protein L31